MYFTLQGQGKLNASKNYRAIPVQLCYAEHWIGDSRSALGLGGFAGAFCFQGKHLRPYPK